MKKIKACLNDKCKGKEKKITYKADDTFCTKCGNELFFVCKKCKTTRIDENADSNLCIRCQAEKEDKNEKMKDGAKKFGTGALAVAGSIGGVAAGIVQFVRKK